MSRHAKHEKGQAVSKAKQASAAKPSAEAPVRRAGFLAAPRASLRAKGSGAPAQRAAGVLTALCAAAVFLALTATPALAHPAHVFEASFGSAGSGAGELSLQTNTRGGLPGSGLAVNDESGDVYVADTANHRVDQFTAAGAFIRAWGWGVENGASEPQTCTTTCQAGLSGSKPGQLEEPTFIAVDNSAGASKGDVYVADSGDELVSKFTPAGKLIESWGNNGPANTPNGQLGGFGSFPPGFAIEGLEGIAVDSSGNLWVRAADVGGSGRGGLTEILEFTPAGAFATDWETGMGNGAIGIAVDSAGDLYLVTSSAVLKFHSSGVEVGAVENGPSHGVGVSGLVVDPTTDDLYVDDGTSLDNRQEGTHINHLPSSCEPAAGFCTPADSFGGPQEETAPGRLSDAQGLAVGPGHLVYAAEAATSTIVAYKQVTVPDVTTGGVANLAQSTATLQGEVNPDGVNVTECFFEYGETTAYGHKVACETEGGAPIGSGKSPVKVHADISGLAAASYHFRLLAKNDEARPEPGADAVFGASIDSSSVQSATTTEATLATRIDPHGLDTTCRLQYVTEAGFNADQPEGFAHATTLPCEPTDLGSVDATQPTCTPYQESNGCVPDSLATVKLAGLAANTNYRFRFLAASAGHTIDGRAELFYTYSDEPLPSCANELLREENASLALPDCRAYEQVSPSSDRAEVYPPRGPAGRLDAQIPSNRPVQSSPDGNAVTYVGVPPSSGQGEGTGNTGTADTGDQYLATRGPGGWSAADIAPSGHGNLESFYEAFTEDLSLGIFGAGGHGEYPLTPEVENDCRVIYSRLVPSGSFSPFFTSGQCGRPFFAGSSRDGSDLIFESMAALPGTGATAGPNPEEGEQTGHDNLYDFSAGRPNLVNVLPGPSPAPAPQATLGSLAGKAELVTITRTPSVDTEGAVSTDGSRVFWTNLATGILYVRENPSQAQSKFASGKCSQPAKACTVQVSAGKATYLTATPDARYAYYTEAGALWRFDTETETRQELAPGSAEVQGVVGLNTSGEDGSYLYFAAQGALAPGAEPRNCKAASGEDGAPLKEQQEATEEAAGAAPAGRGCNLYLLHDGETKLVAVLSALDDAFEGGQTGGSTLYTHGVWSALPSMRAAQLSPDGHTLVFMSQRRLTPYDNFNPAGEGAGNCGISIAVQVVPSSRSCSEIYIYESAGGAISCASCVPSGAPPIGLADPDGENTFLPFDSGSITHAPRIVSTDGARVFFDTTQALLPADTNGRQDVYEWERPGAGSCAHGSALNGGGCLYLISSGRGAEKSSLIDTDAEGRNVFFVTRDRLIPTDRDEITSLYDARENGGFPLSAESIPCPSAELCHQKGTESSPQQSPGTEHFEAHEPAEETCKKGFVKKHGHCVKHHKKPHKHKKHRAKRSAHNNRRAGK